MARRHMHKRRSQPGASPGVFVLDPSSPPPIIRVIAYDENRIEEEELASPADLARYLGKWRTVWVDVDGLGSAEVLLDLAQRFGIHTLALEDIVNTYQRPKVEGYPDHLFTVFRALSPNHEHGSEQVSLILGDGFVVTFDERHGDRFDPVRKRLRERKGRIRQFGADYLFFSILDTIVDGYFPALDELGERLELIEDEVLDTPTPEVLNAIHKLRHELLAIRRIMTASREAINSLIRDAGDFITDSTRIYLRDCYDHTIQIVDIVESQREIAAGLLDIYLSSVSNRMNQVMKVLTVMATLFIPLTFLVGLYGMNFNTAASPLNMPELNWFYGYPAILALMLLTVLVELFFFWRRGWLWEQRRVRKKRKRDF